MRSCVSSRASLLSVFFPFDTLHAAIAPTIFCQGTPACGFSNAETRSSGRSDFTPCTRLWSSMAGSAARRLITRICDPECAKRFLIGRNRFVTDQTRRRNSCSTTRSISFSGAGLPVHISNWRAPCCTNISRPLTTAMPRACASLSSGVSMGL